jgi:hypothetical protein
MDRPVEVLDFEKVGDVAVGLVVDEDGTEQRLLEFQVMGATRGGSVMAIVIGGAPPRWRPGRSTPTP